MYVIPDIFKSLKDLQCILVLENPSVVQHCPDLQYRVFVNNEDIPKHSRVDIS